jgi:isoleucyl-tRNA synthetase
VSIAAPEALRSRLAPYAGELAGFLMVARAELSAADGGRAAEAPLAVSVSRTAYLKCDRCWTYRADTEALGADGMLCGRCTRALAARGI